MSMFQKYLCVSTPPQTGPGRCSFCSGVPAVSVIVVTVIVVGTAAQLGPPGPLIKHAWPSSQLTPVARKANG